MTDGELDGGHLVGSRARPSLGIGAARTAAAGQQAGHPSHAEQAADPHVRIRLCESLTPDGIAVKSGCRARSACWRTLRVTSRH
ncbi:MAG: hypothetical protein GEU81_03290 [Nitriliruptorales bacterium]|nr:hypothetical protein [Nitriliruptorales bacterium]